ncbi:nucleotide exchange factor GrpE [Brevibacterium sp. LE-L]|uniref:nucleotide exchange factor GrpE n=1 Tax=Brevibacterium sp. LE-L TaxID=3418557 RepID=UPI003CFAFDC9
MVAEDSPDPHESSDSLRDVNEVSETSAFDAQGLPNENSFDQTPSWVDSMRRQFASLIEKSAKNAEDKFDQLRAETSAFHERAAAYEDNARSLHSRIEKLQDDQVRSLLKPFFERLSTLHAQALDSSAALATEAPAAAEDFEYFAETIEDMFSLYDIDSVGAAVGNPFDARLHQSARIIATEDPALDATIQRVARQGFIFAGADRVLLPARVSVFRYTPTPDIESEASHAVASEHRSTDTKESSP